jgi:hypothetical protein
VAAAVQAPAGEDVHGHVTAAFSPRDDGPDRVYGTSSGPFGCLIGRAIGGGGFMIDGQPKPNQLA